MDIHSDQTYECTFNECHTVFKTRNQLQKHESDHCKGQLKHKSLYSTESTSVEDDDTEVIECEDYERPYACDWEGCDKRFKDKHNLVRHRISSHEKTEKFQCTFPDCNKVFYSRDYLSNHIWTHKNKGLNINNDSESNKKQEVNKKKKKYREYKCDWVGCDAVLHHSDSINIHIAKHQGKVACQVDGCNYVAGSKRYLRRHQISHSNDRPFQCEHCSKRFKSKLAMTLHIRNVHLNNVLIFHTWCVTTKNVTSRPN